MEAGAASEGAATARARDVERGRPRGVEAVAADRRREQAGEGLSCIISGDNSLLSIESIHSFSVA